MANELIVDFPERSDNYYMRPRDREENNNHGNGGGGRGRGRGSSHPATSRGRSHSYDCHHGRRGHLKITWYKRRKKMANELIVDFPERSDTYYMRPRDRDENNNHGNGHGNGGGGGRGRGRGSPHPASASPRGRSSRSYDLHGRRSHRHGQIEMMSNVKTKRSNRYHRSRSKSCDHDHSSSRDDRSHSQRFSCSCHPPLALHTRSVRFAETSLLHIFTKHEEIQDVHHRDLWYTQEDIVLMKLAAKEDVLKVREQIFDGVFIDGFGEDDTSEEPSSSRIVCTMGIESRLTQARINEVKTCKARCVLAVLKEQKRQHTMMDLSSSSPTSARLRWDMIALTSFSQTRKAALRARRLGMLHEQCVLKNSAKK